MRLRRHRAVVAGGKDRGTRAQAVALNTQPMKPGREQRFKRWSALFEIPALDRERLLRRIQFMERNVMLPVKVVFIVMILYSFESTRWFGQTLSLLDIAAETVQFSFWFYIVANVFFAAIVLAAERL